MEIDLSKDIYIILSPSCLMLQRSLSVWVTVEITHFFLEILPKQNLGVNGKIIGFFYAIRHPLHLGGLPKLAPVTYPKHKTCYSLDKPHQQTCPVAVPRLYQMAYLVPVPITKIVYSSLKCIVSKNNGTSSTVPTTVLFELNESVTWCTWQIVKRNSSRWELIEPEPNSSRSTGRTLKFSWFDWFDDALESENPSDDCFSFP